LALVALLVKHSPRKKKKKYKFLRKGINTP